jgi:hypothetical protein
VFDRLTFLIISADLDLDAIRDRTWLGAPAYGWLCFNYSLMSLLEVSCSRCLLVL